MPRILWFGLGALARAISFVAGLYCDWTWTKLLEGAELAVAFLPDLWNFGCWAVEELAGHYSGQHRYALNC